jgi:hypothetical protein
MAWHPADKHGVSGVLPGVLLPPGGRFARHGVDGIKVMNYLIEDMTVVTALSPTRGIHNFTYLTLEQTPARRAGFTL